MQTFSMCLAVGLASGCWQFAPSDDDSDDDDETTTFEVSAEQETNSCGTTGVDLPESVTMSVDVTIDGHDVTWDDGTISADGDLDDDDVSFEVDDSMKVDMRDAGYTTYPCRIVRTDEISAAFDDSASPDSVDGTWKIRYEPTDDSDCSELVEGSAPVFDALPCSVRYDVEGTVDD